MPTSNRYCKAFDAIKEQIPLSALSLLRELDDAAQDEIDDLKNQVDELFDLVLKYEPWRESV